MAPTHTASSGASGASFTNPTKYSGHKDRVRSLAFNCTGDLIASGSVDKTIKIWSVSSKHTTASSTDFSGHAGEVSNVRWHPQDARVLASCSSVSVDKNVYLWDIRQPRYTAAVETNGDNLHMAWAPDGGVLIVSNRRDVVTEIDTRTHAVTKRTRMAKETNEAIFSADGELLMTTLDGTVHITTFPSRAPVHTLQVSPVAATVLDLDPLGRLLAVGANDSLVTLWDTQELICQHSLDVHEDPVRLLRFSHDGFYLASASMANAIVLSTAHDGRTYGTIETGGTPSSLAWHPSASLLAYAADDPSARGVFYLQRV